MARARQAGGFEEDDPCCHVSACAVCGYSPGHRSSACPRRTSSPEARRSAPGPGHGGREPGG
eukprot:6163439-Alexandrium_andersonii.AAC.1